MDILKRGDSNEDVLRWQQFLTKQGFDIGAIDGIFGGKTELSTKRFQRENNLMSDGIVGAGTWTKAGFNVPSGNPIVPTITTATATFPAKPNFNTPSLAQVQAMFGSFKWEKVNSSEIRILDGWADRNIVEITLTPIIGKLGAPSNGVVRVHHLAAPQFLGAFNEIERKGLSNRIISFAGTYYPRLIRGSSSQLSNHSFGSAIDVNAPENWLAREPAKTGVRGCLYEIVPIMNKWGFFWGGHYNNRKDGMHFEVAKILSAEQIQSLQNN